MPSTRVCRGNYIQGQYLKITDPNGEIFSRNPGDLEETPVEFPFSYEHVHEAVTAAKSAFLSWKRLDGKERTARLKRYRDGLQTRRDELALHVSFEVGKPLWESRLEIDTTLALIDDALERGSQTAVECEIENAGRGSRGLVRFVPRGVMVILSPAGQPVYAPHAHFIPALLHGNTVVMRSSRYAPMVAQTLADISHESGMPAGVFNLIHGDEETGRRLVAHPAVDGIFFTGPYETSFNIKKQILSDYWKLFVAECGGKNGMLLWSDCNYDRALKHAMLASFLTTGQRCTTTSRILVHEQLFDRFVEDFHALAKKATVGYGLDDGKQAPFMGPLVSETAQENYLRYQGMAVREGCEEIMRGKTLERDRKGYYVSPSIHWVTTPNAKSVYQKSEMFAPNVALYKVTDLEEAAEILNLPQHGLVASLYTGARENYVRLADEVKVGLLHWNRMTIEPAFRLPAGGIKKSGNARPMGSFAPHQCTYPVSSLEPVGADVDDFPEQMPKL